MGRHKEREVKVEGFDRRSSKGKGLIDMSISPSGASIGREGKEVDVDGLLKEIQERGQPSFPRKSFHAKGKK